MLVGAGVAFGLLGALTIGVFVLPVAGLAAIGLTRIPAAASGVSGVVAGAGVGPLFVAYLNRDGPGDVCTVTARSSACVGEWSPWPWMAVGLVLVGVGFALFAARAGWRR
jgi:ABC-type Fe3+-siderophore transport system permease subunit